MKKPQLHEGLAELRVYIRAHTSVLQRRRIHMLSAATGKKKIAAFIIRHLVSHSTAATSREYGSLLSSSTAVLPAFSTLATRGRNHVLHAAMSTATMFRRLVVTLLQLLGQYGAVYSSIREIVGSAAAAAVAGRNQILHSSTCTITVFGRLVATLLQLLGEYGAVYREIVGSAAASAIAGRNQILHSSTFTTTVFGRLVATLLQLLEENGAVYSSIREIVGSAAAALAGRNQVLYSSTFTTTVFGRLVAATLLQLLEEKGAFSVPAAVARLATRTRSTNSVRVLLACTGSVFRRSLS